MTKFILIRHANTNAAGKRLAGRMAGIDLNEEGRMQAVKLAERLKDLPLAAVYSSPMERARQTAQPLCEVLNIDCLINEDFTEIEFGEWTNKTVEEMKEEPQFHLFNSFRSFTRIPGGELMLEAQARMIRGLEKLRTQHANEIVAVISHSDVIKAAIAYYAGIHLDMFQRIEISPASVSVVEIYDETARIMLVNDTGEIGA